MGEACLEARGRRALSTPLLQLFERRIRRLTRSEGDEERQAKACGQCGHATSLVDGGPASLGLFEVTVARALDKSGAAVLLRSQLGGC